ENYPKVVRLCVRYFGDRDKALDAAQEVFLKVWLNLNTFRGEAAIGTWIYRIATNVCLTYSRDAKKVIGSGISLPETGSFDLADEQEEGDSDRDEKLRFFEGFLSKLPSIDKTLVSLYLEELDTREISSVTGLSEANVRTRIHRIKKQVKKEWEEKNGTR
nr:RNA polymerase sigma factor [Bacteroidales bacterium]